MKIILRIDRKFNIMETSLRNVKSELAFKNRTLKKLNRIAQCKRLKLKIIFNFDMKSNKIELEFSPQVLNYKLTCTK